MAEFWRYQDRLAAGQLIPKRLRNELGEVLQHGSARYDHGGLFLGERDTRAFDYGLNYTKAGADYGLDYSKAEADYGLDYSKAGVDLSKAGLDYSKGGVDFSKAGVDYNRLGAAYGSAGYTGAEITGLADGTLLSAVGSGSLKAPTLGLSAAPTLGLSALEDPQVSWKDASLMKGASAGFNGTRSSFTATKEFSEAISGLLSHPLASRSLFVEGLPIDCSRREAAHIFRRFRGYKDIRLNQKGKGTKKSGVLLCFVDFEDSFSAARALEALRGYKFDEDDSEGEPLQMQFSTRGPRNILSNPPRRKRRH